MNILLTPARIGEVEIRNRIVLPPMTTRTADAEGFVTDDTVAYYLARVEGGVGLITVEMASPEKAGRHRHCELGHSASGVRGHVRDHRAGSDDQGAHRADKSRVCRGRAACATRRLRLRGDSRGARLSHLAVPQRVREPAQ